MGIRELIEQQQQDGDRIGLSPQQIRTASEKQAFGSAPFIGRTLTDLIGKGVEIPTKLIAGAGEKLLEPSSITGRRAMIKKRKRRTREKRKRNKRNFIGYR